MTLEVEGGGINTLRVEKERSTQAAESAQNAAASGRHRHLGTKPNGPGWSCFMMSSLAINKGRYSFGPWSVLPTLASETARSNAHSFVLCAQFGDIGQVKQLSEKLGTTPTAITGLSTIKFYKGKHDCMTIRIPATSDADICPQGVLGCPHTASYAFSLHGPNNP